MILLLLLQNIDTLESRMKVSRLFFALPLLVTTVVANSYVTPDRSGSCYIFKDNKLSKRGICLISAEMSQGHEYRDLSFEGKVYELYFNSNISPTAVKLNGVRAKFYYRESRFYKIISSSSLKEGDPPLNCYKTKNLDVCYKDFN